MVNEKIECKTIEEKGNYQFLLIKNIKEQCGCSYILDEEKKIYNSSEIAKDR